MFGTRIFDVESFDGDGTVPVAAVDRTKRPHADVLPVNLDVHVKDVIKPFLIKKLVRFTKECKILLIR